MINIAENEVEKIKQLMLKLYSNHKGFINPYSDNELHQAAELINKFLIKVNNMVVLNEGGPRKLNNLERFVAIYEFVADRVFSEQTTSHDLIGVLLTNKGVCQGYCQLMELLCEILNIPFLYKHCNSYDENEKPLESHGNFEVIIEDGNGFKHCLHCDPTIDSPKEDGDVLGFNALLIHDLEVNKYYHKQKPIGGDISGFFNNFMSDEMFLESIAFLSKVNPIEVMFSNKSEEEVINDHFIELKNNLIKLNKFFKLDINFEVLDNSQLIEAYKAMYKYYISIACPINPEELKQAIITVKTAEIMYEKKLGYTEAQEQSRMIFEERMKKSIDSQEKYWDNTAGMSLMFTELSKIKN